SQDTARDRGDVGVARPTGDGEAIRHLDQVPVCISKLVIGIAHRRPRHQFWRSKNYTTVHAGTGKCLAWTSNQGDTHVRRLRRRGGGSSPALTCSSSLLLSCCAVPPRGFTLSFLICARVSSAPCRFRSWTAYFCLCPAPQAGSRHVMVANSPGFRRTCSSRARVAHGGVGKSSALSFGSTRCAVTALDVFFNQHSRTNHAVAARTPFASTRCNPLHLLHFGEQLFRL